MSVTDAFGRPWKLEDVKSCVGPGWVSLIEELYKLCDENDIMITQVKEKFGGLRFYIGGASMEINDKIEEVEKRSFEICEACGEPGKVGSIVEGGYWVATLCDTCRDERRKK